MLQGVESYKYLLELWAFLVLYAKSSRRDDCKMHILRSDAFLYAKNAKSFRRDDCKMHILRSDAFLLCQIGLVARLGRFIAVPECQIY